MFKILRKKCLNENVVLMDIEAPFVAKKALAGQFIIFRVDEEGERIPLTIADYDRERGRVTIIFQTVGLSTKKLAMKNEGEYISDFVGLWENQPSCRESKRFALSAAASAAQSHIPRQSRCLTTALRSTLLQASEAVILLFLKIK